MWNHGGNTKPMIVPDGVWASHVAPLNRLAERWRRDETEGMRFVPWFDPDSGGVHARVLILLESPAASTVQTGPTALSSEDNDNPSSRAFRAARIESGLDRADYLRWNIIPWASSAPRAPSPTALDAARPALHELLQCLPQLTGIVALGNSALTGMMRYLTLHADPLIVPVLGAPHPSPANGHHRHEQHERTVNALRRARDAQSRPALHRPSPCR